MDNKNSIVKLSGIVIIIAFIITLLYLGKAIIVPLFVGFILALILYPVNRLLENWKIPRILAIIIIFITITGLIGGILFFFSNLFYDVFKDIQSFETNIKQLYKEVVKFLNTNVFKESLELKDLYQNKSGEIIETSTSVLGNIITFSTTFLFNLTLTIIYTFLLLLYRTSFKHFFLMFYQKDKRENIRNLITKVQKVIQRYFYGLLIVIIIVGTLNGLGMYIIGLDHAFLFGYFAALLTIIPYIGTTLGGTLPFLYALFFHDNIWIAAGVVLIYFSIQQLEGNILTPKIVGDQVKLNPLFALLSLIVGGFIWGIAGMILFIPLIAILKVVFDHTEHLKPYADLLSSKYSKK